MLPAVLQKATISTLNIMLLVTGGFLSLALKGTAEPGRPRAFKTTLDIVSIGRAFPCTAGSLMDSMSVVRRFPLALAEDF